MAAHGVGSGPCRAVLDPLRFARLPRDHRHRVRGGGRVLGREDVVEDREAAGPLPEERDGVAVDVRHDKARELRALCVVGRPAVLREAVVFVVGELVHLRHAVHDVDLGCQTRCASGRRCPRRSSSARARSGTAGP